MAEAQKQKIVIIGGGIAGLTAGIYAQKAGFDSEVYEKHAILGGQCTGWKRKGFYIDNCISWMTCADPKFPVYKMWKEVGFLGDADGNTIPVLQHDAFYTSELDGQTVTLWRDLDRAQKEMIELSPQDKKQIKKFFKYVRMCESLQVPYIAPLNMMRLSELIKIGIPMIPVGLTLLKYGKTSLVDLAKKFKHPLLKKMLTDYLPKDYLAYILICAYGTLSSGGGGIPDGGSSKVIERMEEIYLKHGGKVFKNSPAQKIIVEENRATEILLQNGETVSADYVIPTCDPNYLFTNLLDNKFMPKELKKAFENTDAYKLGSTFHVAYEYDGIATDIGRRTFFECSGFELAGRHVTRMSMKNYDLEPTTAPQGKSLIQVKLLQNEDDCKYWQDLYNADKEEYKRKKQKAADDILRMLEERVPSAKGKMKVLDIWTPQTYARYTNATRGVYIGFIITKKGSFLKLSGELKGLKNVFLAGQWLTTPHGLPMAMTSGKFAVQRILRSQKKPYKIEP